MYIFCVNIFSISRFSSNFASSWIPPGVHVLLSYGGSGDATVPLVRDNCRMDNVIVK